MAEADTRQPGAIDAVRRYLAALPRYGIHPRRAVLYGSFARDEAGEWSDIDLVVIAPEFDGSVAMELVETLWRATLAADIRIEPIACGEREWETDDSRPILEIARKEGIVIAA
ncbi:MAG: nucleotidyltransferase domain-containing protein [Candidatus Sumerlaeota bacterium]|nr:nucleotidyltransferase domain-containing protein [Candidatus Sumerlaeota bacterium]